MVPGGGIEPPRAEARRILSPLRLPVPPSRLEWRIQYRTTELRKPPAGCARRRTHIRAFRLRTMSAAHVALYASALLLRLTPGTLIPSREWRYGGQSEQWWLHLSCWFGEHGRGFGT